MIIIPVVAVMLAVLIGGGILIFKELNKKNDEKSKKDVENVTETSILDDDKDSKDNTEEVSETSDINEEEITEILESEVVDADIQNLDNSIPSETDKMYSAYLNFLVNNKGVFSMAEHWHGSCFNYGWSYSDDPYISYDETVCLYDITSDGIPELITLLADENANPFGTTTDFHPVLAVYTYNAATDGVDALLVYNLNMGREALYSLYLMPGNKLVLFEAPSTTFFGYNFTTEFEYNGSEFVISKSIYEIGTDFEADRVIDGVLYDYSTFYQVQSSYIDSLVFEDVLLFNVIPSPDLAIYGSGIYEKTPIERHALSFVELVDSLYFKLGATSIPDGTYDIVLNPEYSFDGDDYSFLAFYALDHFEMTDEQVQSIKIGDYIDLSAWKIGVRDGFGISVTGNYTGELTYKYDDSQGYCWLDLGDDYSLYKFSGETNWILTTTNDDWIYRDIGAFKIKVSDNVVVTDYTHFYEEGKEYGYVSSSIAGADFLKEHSSWRDARVTIQNNEVIALVVYFHP